MRVYAIVNVNARVDHPLGEAVAVFLERGAAYSPSNVVAACKTCNAKRGNRLKRALHRGALFGGARRLPARADFPTLFGVLPSLAQSGLIEPSGSFLRRIGRSRNFGRPRPIRIQVACIRPRASPPRPCPPA